MVAIVTRHEGTHAFDAITCPLLTIGAQTVQVYSAVALAIGELLHVSNYDYTNDVFIVEKADADTTGKPAQLIATTVNAGSAVSTARTVYDMSSVACDVAVGSPVYLDATTAGGFALVAPTGADQIVQIVGRVKVRHASAGEIVFDLTKHEITVVGTSGLQPLAVTGAKMASATVTMTQMAPDVARKFTVYSAVALAIGELLHISSYNVANDVFVVEKADADTTGKEAHLVATATNAGGTTSEARDIFTSPASMACDVAVGSPVYLDNTTAGGITTSAPTGADQVAQIVGRVKVQHATEGVVVFRLALPEMVKIGTSGLQDLAVTTGKIAANAVTAAKMEDATVTMTQMAANVARKFTVYSAVALAIGELLHISSYNVANDVFVVEKADADTTDKPAHLVATATNAGGTTSEARDIFVSPATMAVDVAVGSPVYLDATTAGGITTVAPTGADQVAQIVGRVKVQHATEGVVAFRLALPELVKIGTGGLQDLSVTGAKMANATVTMTQMAPDVARKFTVYSAVALAINELLHISSYNVAGDVFVVEKADADTTDKPAHLVATATNAGNTTSEARDMFTSPATMVCDVAVGSPIYLDATTAGGIATVAPTGADQIAQIVGRVKVQHATEGVVVFRLPGEIVKAGTGGLQDLSVTTGKLAAGALTFAKHADDESHSIFFVAGEIDFGESNAVTVDLGAIGYKATLIGGYWVTTEAQAGGDATTDVVLGTATGGGSAIATRIITLANTAEGQSNYVGGTVAILPVAGVDMASTDHLWLDCADDVAGTRSAGKVKVFAILQKSA